MEQKFAMSNSFCVIRLGQLIVISPGIFGWAICLRRPKVTKHEGELLQPFGNGACL